MLPLIYGSVYKTPDDYNPPEETNLADNTNYPNLNSRDYAKRPLNHNVRMHENWECIRVSTNDTDQSGNVSICTNKLSGRRWTGMLLGFEKVDVVKDNTSIGIKLSCFKLESQAIINCMEYVDPTNLLLALNTGNLQLWSTQSEVRNSNNPYCPFLIGEKFEHMKPIISLIGFKTNSNKAVTGSKDGALKIWDMGSAELISTQSYRHAHVDSITGLTSSPTNDAIFSTCALDKSCLLWDDRETRPATVLYTNHNVRFKSVSWALDPAESFVYLGDESGSILTIDIRKPNKVLNLIHYFDRPIRKISPNRENLAVIADSNCVKISKSPTHAIFYENRDSQHFIRDCAWLSPNELLTVGFEGKMRYHKIK